MLYGVILPVPATYIAELYNMNVRALMPHHIEGWRQLKYGFSSGYLFIKVAESSIFNSYGRGAYLYEAS